MKDLGETGLPVYARQSLRLRQERFGREKSPGFLRARIEELQLADLVGDLGILSRRAVDLRLRRMAERMLRGNLDEVPGLAVAYGDLDGLKLINDAGGKNQGHEMGDAALVNVAEQMAKVRPGDIVARLGNGDEFGVIMSASSSEQAKLLMLGAGERDGFVPRTQMAVASGRERLREKFGERWVADTPEKKPGNVTMGWEFLSREEFVELYKKWQADRAGSEAGVGDFSTYVFGGADKTMFEKKT